MWQLIAFSEIAGRTTYYQIFGAIGTAAIQGDNVIDMVFVFESFVAVVATTFLQIILTFNIRERMCSDSAFFTSAIAMGRYATCIAIVLVFFMQSGGASDTIANKILRSYFLPMFFIVFSMFRQQDIMFALTTLCGLVLNEVFVFGAILLAISKITLNANSHILISLSLKIEIR